MDGRLFPEPQKEKCGKIKGRRQEHTFLLAGSLGYIAHDSGMEKEAVSRCCDLKFMDSPGFGNTERRPSRRRDLQQASGDIQKDIPAHCLHKNGYIPVQNPIWNACFVGSMPNKMELTEANRMGYDVLDESDNLAGECAANKSDPCLIQIMEQMRRSAMNCPASLDFSLFQIKLFFTVAETRSFSHAAEEIHMEQSTLSRRILVLEQTLGFPLFDRNSRPIRLTHKGEILYEQWKPLINAFEHTLLMISDSHGEDARILTVCMMDAGMQLNDVPAITQRMQETAPGISLTFHYSRSSQWRPLLEQGVCDIAVTIQFDTVDIGPDFAVNSIVTVPNLICMLKSNPLSKKDSITYEDLVGQHFIAIDDDENPRHAQFIRQVCRSHGVEPAIDRRVHNAHGLTSALQHNDEVLICDRFLRGYDNPMFKLYRLPNSLSGLCAVYSKNCKNPCIQPYIQLLKSFYNDSQIQNERL